MAHVVVQNVCLWCRLDMMRLYGPLTLRFGSKSNTKQQFMAVVRCHIVAPRSSISYLFTISRDPRSAFITEEIVFFIHIFQDFVCFYCLHQTTLLR